MDVKARREVINDIQRHLARTYIAVCPNLGYDYGGRLLTAWLDR